jgi:hypothetical protein
MQVRERFSPAEAAASSRSGLNPISPPRRRTTPAKPAPARRHACVRAHLNSSSPAVWRQEGTARDLHTHFHARSLHPGGDRLARSALGQSTGGLWRLISASPDSGYRRYYLHLTPPSEQHRMPQIASLWMLLFISGRSSATDRRPTISLPKGATALGRASSSPLSLSNCFTCLLPRCIVARSPAPRSFDR